MKNIEQDKFLEYANSGEYVILDVRQPVECVSGKVPNAQELDFMDRTFFMEEISKLDKDKKYLVYCRSGNRSGQACAMMDNMGFGDTNNLIGGLLSWTGPLVK